MSGVKVTIIEYVSDSQPGWVRCVLTDAQNIQWFLTEKVPTVTAMQLDDQSGYPQEGIINCVVIHDDPQSDFIQIDTGKPYGIESEKGKTMFTVCRRQLIIK